MYFSRVELQSCEREGEEQGCKYATDKQIMRKKVTMMAKKKVIRILAKEIFVLCDRMWNSMSSATSWILLWPLVIWQKFNRIQVSTSVLMHMFILHVADTLSPSQQSQSAHTDHGLFSSYRDKNEAQFYFSCSYEWCVNVINEYHVCRVRKCSVRCVYSVMSVIHILSEFGQNNGKLFMLDWILKYATL